jgi:hypothetical protein
MKKLGIIILIPILAVSLFADGAPNFKRGDLFVQGRSAFGGVGVSGADFGFVVGAEYGFQNDFFNLSDLPSTLGIGGSFGYSTYSSNYSLGGKWKYTVIVLLANATYHAPLFDNDKIDPFVMLSVGANIGDVKYKGPLADYNSPSFGGAVFGTSVGAKYFFSDAMAAVIELGWGLGLLRIGLDYKIK